MKNAWKKAVVPVVLAVALVAPMSVMAAPSGEHVKPSQSRFVQMLQEKRGAFLEHRSDRQDRREEAKVKGTFHVHSEMYIGLLAEKYAPDLTDEWEAAFADRELVVSDLKELAPALREEVKEQLEQLRGVLDAAPESGQVGRIAIRQRIAERLQAKRAEHQPQSEERKALYDEFTQAVASKDASRIHAALAKKLEQYKADTAKLHAKLAELQAGQPQA